MRREQGSRGFTRYIYRGKERETPLFAPLPSARLSPSCPFSLRRLRATAAAAAPVFRFSTFSRFILTASSLNRFPGEIYGRAIIQEERARASCTQSATVQGRRGRTGVQEGAKSPGSLRPSSRVTGIPHTFPARSRLLLYLTDCFHPSPVTSRAFFTSFLFTLANPRARAAPLGRIHSAPPGVAMIVRRVVAAVPVILRGI